MIQIRAVAFSIVLQQYVILTSKWLRFQMKNLSTAGNKVYEIECIWTLFWKVVFFVWKHFNQSQKS